jgi:hypothetical protein
MKRKINHFHRNRSISNKCFGNGLFVTTVLLAISVSTTLAQNIIGINFAGREWSIGGNTPQALASSDHAGVVSQQNWNNANPAGYDSGTQAQITSPNSGSISDNSGAPTGLTLNYTGQGMWSVSQTVYTGNQQLMNGYSDVEANDPTIGIYAISNISYSIYDVYVYVAADGNGRTLGVNLAGGSQIYLNTDANGYNYSNPLIQGAATTQAGATNAHYVYFHNVTGSGFEVDVHRYGNNAGVAGIQIVDTSGLYKPTVALQPAPEELYVGRTAQFVVSASGTAPFSYHWRTNGVYLNDGGNIAGSSTNVLTITNLSLANAANYDVVITNTFGSVTSIVAQLTVVVPAANSFEAAVVSNSPTAYYRLNETGDPTSVPNLPAFDYIGGDNGIYGAAVLNLFQGINGPQPTDGFPGFKNGNGAAEFTHGYNVSQITVSSLPINTNTVTLMAWINPSGSENVNDGLIFNRGGNIAGFGYTGNTDGNGNYTLGYTWNNDPNTYSWNSGLVPPANQWSLVALVVTPTNATIYLANTNGITAAIQTYPHIAQSFGQVTIGADPFNNDGSRAFDGKMDEVAIFNRALSQSQVVNMFSSASGLTSFAPHLVMQPVSQFPYAQQSARFSVAALGSAPLDYQWQAGTNGIYINLADGGRVSGTHTSTLAISSVALTDPANYIVIVSNSSGSVTSSPAMLAVTSCSYWNTAAGYGPVAYYSLNEVGDPAGGNLVAHDYVGGFDGIYGSHVKNGNSNYAVAGPLSTDGFPEFLTNNWAAQIIPNDLNGHVTVSPWNLNTNTVTITCWIRPLGVASAWSGLVFCRGTGVDAAGQPAGLNFTGSTDANGNRILGYTWGGNSAGLNLAPPTNQWSFLALVVTPTNETIYMFNTSTTNSATAVSSNDVLGFAGTTMIGCDPYDTAGRNFNGMIDEVAIYGNALSQGQLSTLYTAAQVPIVSGSVVLTNSWNGTSLNLTWPGNGMLLQATNVTGPWTTNTGATSPFVVIPAGPSMFYRIQGQ